MSAAATLAAFPVAALAIWGLLRSPAARRRLVATPSDERWHTAATPTFGGVGIVAGLVAGIGAALAVGAVEPRAELFGIVGGCALLFAAGLADDLFDLSALAKLVAQVAAAGIAVASGLTVEIVGTDWLALAIALVWLVGITNAFNLLDNMDGLAVTLATIACAYLAVDAVTAHPNEIVLVVALSLGLACAGFLPFNLRPGRGAAVFMGDSGSQPLGFAIAALTLASSWTIAGTTVTTMVLPLLVLAVPILDTTLVTVRRLLERRPVTQGGRDHTSHRLVYYGLSERRAVAVLALLAALLGATGLAYNVLDNGRVTIIGVLLSFVVLVQFASFLSDLEERSRRGDAAVEPTLLQALFAQPRRLVEVLVDFAIICASFLAAYLLQVGGSGTPVQRDVFLAALPVLLGVRYVLYVIFQIYRRVWRFADVRDIAALAIATALAAPIALGIVAATRSLQDFPPEVFLVDALICAAVVAASRLTVRLLPRLAALVRRDEQVRVLIVGAGRSGRMLVRELQETPGQRVVGFVDDNARVRGRRVHGVKVLGALDEARRILEAARPDEVLITIPDAPAERLDVFVHACGEAGLVCRIVRRHTEITVPPLVEVVTK